jgi:hypothetical protein
MTEVANERLTDDVARSCRFYVEKLISPCGDERR